jgi:alcohol dehydrogenase, propanol-preferring
MKAMRLPRIAPVERSPLEPADLPDPRPGPNEVVLDVEACGVCRTDLHIVEGEVAGRLPIVPGHQVAGTVRECGTGVAGLRPGDRVGVAWLSKTCGRCAFCRSERENLCRLARFTGRDRDGGYAERMTAPERAVYRLPQGFTARQAAPLLCAGVIGYRTLRLSGARGGGKLGLFGFGASAHLVLQVARHEGCEVFVFTREPRHRELALEMGAVWAGGAEDDPGVLLDAAASFAPAGEIIPLALARLDRGGTLAVNAIHMNPIPSFPYEKLYGERVVRSVTNFTRRDALEFLELAGRIPVRAEIEEFPLSAANEALVKVKRGEIRGAAVLVIRDEQLLEAGE